MNTKAGKLPALWGTFLADERLGFAKRSKFPNFIRRLT